MTTLNVVFDKENSPRFPVYHKYPQQYQAQPAFIYLDIRDGECGADYSGEIGGAVPFDVWHNKVLRFAISPELMASEIAEIIEDNSDAFQTILDGASVEWDGSNNVGRFTDSARNVITELEHLFDCGAGGSEVCMIDEEYFSTWIENSPFPSDGQTIESFAQELLGFDGEDGSFFAEGMNSLDAIMDALKRVWADEYLYMGCDIPQSVAKFLLDDGCCEDSEWMEELKEFAKG